MVFGKIAEMLDKFKFNIVPYTILAVVLTTDYHLSNRYLVCEFDTHFNKCAFGQIRMYNTFDDKHEKCIIKVMLRHNSTVADLEEIFKRLQKDYDITLTHRIIYLKTSKDSVLEQNIKDVFPNIEINYMK